MSLVIAYASYAWILQTPFFFSRSRLALGGILWAALTIILVICRLDRSRLFQQPWRNLLPAVGSLFVLLNLLAAAFFSRVPYTYLLLPQHSVVVQSLSPASQIEIRSFTTENEGLQEIHRFLPTEQWRGLGSSLTSQLGAESPLVWQGKPGQFVEIHFKTCPTCGEVEIQTGGQTERLNLAQGEQDGMLLYRKLYASLFFHRAANWILLEAAIFLTAALISIAAARLLKSSAAPRTPPFMVPAAWHNAAVFGALVALTAIQYGFRLQPILYNDDWCQIVYDAHAGRLSLFMLDSRRPLHLFFAALYSQFLTLDQTVLALYLTQLGVLILTAYLIYRLAREGFGASAGPAFLCAALWLVYPNDYTYLYISMLAARTAFLLCVVCLLLTLRVLRRGSWLAAVGAGASALLGLLMYEGHLGLITVGPVLFALLERKQLTPKKIAAIALSYAGIAIFLVWRIFIQPRFYQDAKLASLDFEAGELAARWLQTVKTLLGGFRLPADASWLPGDSPWTLILWGLGAFLVGGVFLALPASPAKRPVVHQLAVGALLWAAGFFPILINYPVNIYSHLSRVNLFSNLGAVLLIIGLLQVLASSLGSVRYAPKILLALSLPLLLVSSLAQQQVQEGNRQSWAEAKTFYATLVSEIPDLKQDTQVLFSITTGEEETFTRRPLFTSSWEAACAVRTLYEIPEPNLQVGYRYTDLSQAPFPGFNILGGAMETNSIGDVPDPSKLLVLSYNLKTADLEIVQDIGFLGLGSVDSYKPLARITPATRDFPTRRLIAPE